MTHCPCDQNKPFENCCGPYIKGDRDPEFPVDLMRSRYSAYAFGQLDYIQKTMIGQARNDFSLESAKEMINRCEWMGLDIVSTHITNNSDGTVEFKATYRINADLSCLHEVSNFKKFKGRWYYSSGKIITD